MIPSFTPSGPTIVLVEIEAYDSLRDRVTTLRYCSGAGYHHPSAPGYYAPRVHQGLSLRQWAFQSGRSWGASRVDIGEIRLVNRDSGLYTDRPAAAGAEDAQGSLAETLAGLICDGRAARVLVGPADGRYGTAGSVPAGHFTVLATGTVS
ncbi:MAG: hypothetical protein K2Q10_11295, partial [Rhodospirillales bacterium]|nr:hypothetical protein [Rhodospirillales bacterium]